MGEHDQERKHKRHFMKLTMIQVDEVSLERLINDGGFHGLSRFATFTGENRVGCRHFNVADTSRLLMPR